jgi:hypothetical protein
VLIAAGSWGKIFGCIFRSVSGVEELGLDSRFFLDWVDFVSFLGAWIRELRGMEVRRVFPPLVSWPVVCLA